MRAPKPVAMRRFSARNSRVLGLDLLHLDRIERRVPRRHGEGGGALEHRELVGLLGDDRDRLDGRRARADDADALAGEVDAFVGPLAGVVGRALERRRAGDVGRVGGAQAAGGHDHEASRQVVALIGLHPPGAGRVVEGGRGHLGLELDVLAQVEAIGDVVGVREDLGLRGVPLGPLPLLLQVLVEPVGVLHALDVAAGTRIAVPVPRAAHAVAGLEDLHGQVLLPQLVQHVEAGEPRADHDDVDVPGPLSHPGNLRLLCALSTGMRCSRHRTGG